MIYITRDDLSDDTQDRFIEESTVDKPQAVDKIVAKVVGMLVDVMSERYDTAKIFDEQNPIRNEYLVDIIRKLSLYSIFRRNAPRKVTTDIKEDYNWALKQLEKINAGSLSFANLPKAPSQEGDPGDLLIGNISNKNYYI